MKKKNIPFSPPDMSEREIELVVEALRSGWITTGPKTKELERKVAELCQTKRAACLGSATAGLELVLRMFGIGEGDEVIVPAYTYTATASVVCHVGAKLVMVDSQEDSIEMDYAKMADAITERTKAIIPVDLGGIIADYDAVFKAVEEKKSLFRPANDMQKALGRILVLADAAHALGAERHGLKSGNIADFSSFSFHAVKNFTTAEGGAVTWRQHDGIDNDYVYQQFMLLSLHGQNKDALAKTIAGAWEYDIVAPYYKCNMTDILAAVGLAQYERYPKMLERRHEIIRRYNEAFKSYNVKLMHHSSENHVSSGHLYIVRIDDCDEQKRNAIYEKMANLGVVCNVHYKPLPMMTGYKNLGFDIADYPNAYALYAKSITLPLNTRLSDEDVEYIIDCFTKVLSDL